MKKFLTIMIAVLVLMAPNVFAAEDTCNNDAVKTFVQELRSSKFFKDFSYLNSGDYKTTVEYKDGGNSFAIVGKHKGNLDYILFYDYDCETGILSYRITDLTEERNEDNLKKHIVAALYWNQYVIDTANNIYANKDSKNWSKNEFLTRYKDIDPCTLTLEKNGIKVTYESLNPTRISALGKELTNVRGFYTGMDINIKDGMYFPEVAAKDKFDNPLINFESANVANPSTGVIETTTFVIMGIMVIGGAYFSFNNIRKLRLQEQGGR